MDKKREASKKNRELNAEEIRLGKTILESLPRRLIVTLSTRCNSRCIMCEVKKNVWDLPQKTISEIKELFPVLESVAWQGGEVFYMPFFEELFDSASVFPGLKQTIVTNGLLLSEKWIEKLVQAPVELAVSVDGTTKEVYEKIRSGSDFNRLKKNLAQLKKLRKKPSPMSLRLHTVVMRSNLDQMTEFVLLAEEFGFDALHFMPLYGNEEPGEDLFRHGEELSEIESIRIKLKEVSQKAKEAGIEFLNSLPVSFDEKKDSSEKKDVRSVPENSKKGEAVLLCTLPWQQMNLDPGGEVRPGCLCTSTVGRVPEMTLLEIWNSFEMQKYRKALLAKENRLCFRNCIEGRVPAELRRI